VIDSEEGEQSFRILIGLQFIYREDIKPIISNGGNEMTYNVPRLIAVKSRGHYELLDTESRHQFGWFSSQRAANRQADKILLEKKEQTDVARLMDGWTL
jgi:hypothetical protein